MARGSKTIRITYPFLPSARERFHAGLTSRQQRRDAGTLHRMRTFHVSRHFTTGLESIFHTNTRSRQKEFFHLSLRQVYVDDVTVLHFLIRRGMIAKPGAVKQEREEWRQREWARSCSRYGWSNLCRSGHYKREVCCARFSHDPMNTLQHGRRDPCCTAAPESASTLPK